MSTSNLRVPVPSQGSNGDPACVFQSCLGGRGTPEKGCRPSNLWTSLALQLAHDFIPHARLCFHRAPRYDMRDANDSASILGQLHGNLSQLSTPNIFLTQERVALTRTFLGPWSTTLLSLLYSSQLIPPRLNMDLMELYPPVLVAPLVSSLPSLLLNRHRRCL